MALSAFEITLTSELENGGGNSHEGSLLSSSFTDIFSEEVENNDVEDFILSVETPFDISMLVADKLLELRSTCTLCTKTLLGEALEKFIERAESSQISMTFRNSDHPSYDLKSEYIYVIETLTGLRSDLSRCEPSDPQTALCKSMDSFIGRLFAVAEDLKQEPQESVLNTDRSSRSAEEVNGVSTPQERPQTLVLAGIKGRGPSIENFVDNSDSGCHADLDTSIARKLRAEKRKMLRKAPRSTVDTTFSGPEPIKKSDCEICDCDSSRSSGKVENSMFLELQNAIEMRKVEESEGIETRSTGVVRAATKSEYKVPGPNLNDSHEQKPKIVEPSASELFSTARVGQIRENRVDVDSGNLLSSRSAASTSLSTSETRLTVEPAKSSVTPSFKRHLPPIPKKISMMDAIQDVSNRFARRRATLAAAPSTSNIPEFTAEAEDIMTASRSGRSHIESRLLSQDDSTPRKPKAHFKVDLGLRRSGSFRNLTTKNQGKMPLSLESKDPISSLAANSKVSNALSSFQRFTEAQDLPEILSSFHDLTSTLNLQNKAGPQISHTIKIELCLLINYAQGHLFRILDAKVKEFRRLEFASCQSLNVVVIGAGPVGLRAAIDLALLGCNVTIIERRTTFTRPNILHLWDWVCHDLLKLGVNQSDLLGKSFYHVGTRNLQVVLAKVCLLLGVKIESGTEFKSLAWSNSGCVVNYASVSGDQSTQVRANVIIGAGGVGDPLLTHVGFERKSVKLSNTMGIVAHFKRGGSQREQEMEEFSWSRQFKGKMFNELQRLGADLENIVYYQGSTHYFVMTPKKGCLLDAGVLKQDRKSGKALLDPNNIDKRKLRSFVRKIADFFNFPKSCEFLSEFGGAQLFDFSSRHMSKSSCKFISQGSKHALVALVGDALLEPFWPEGLGVNRGFMSAMDTAFIIQKYFSNGETSDPKVMTDHRDALYNLMRGLSGHTKQETICDEFKKYSLNPSSRYKQKIFLGVADATEV